MSRVLWPCQYTSALGNASKSLEYLFPSAFTSLTTGFMEIATIRAREHMRTTFKVVIPRSYAL